MCSESFTLAPSLPLMPAYSDHSELELLRLIALSDELAFEEIYKRYWDKIYAVAFHRLKTTQEAEDIVQTIFLNLWRRRSALPAFLNINAYLSTAVKYEILNRLAKENRHLDYQHHIKRQGLVGENTTQEMLSFDELQKNIEQTVRALPEKCQLVYRLSREGNLTEKEIAQQMNISTKTVESHLTKALKALRNAVLKARHIFVSLF